MRHLTPFAWQTAADPVEGADPAPCEHEFEMERAEREIDDLRATVRKLESALRTAQAVLAPYARKI